MNRKDELKKDIKSTSVQELLSNIEQTIKKLNIYCFIKIKKVQNFLEKFMLKPISF